MCWAQYAIDGFVDFWRIGDEIHSFDGSHDLTVVRLRTPFHKQDAVVVSDDEMNSSQDGHTHVTHAMVVEGCWSSDVYLYAFWKKKCS